MLTPPSVTERRESHFSLHSRFPGFPTAHCFNFLIRPCTSLCAKIVCPVALWFTWSKIIPQIVALGGRWQLLCNRFSRFLLDLHGWGCHLDSMSSAEISHWPLWAAFRASCQVWRKEWGCSDLHLPIKRILWGNLLLLLANSLPRHNRCASPFYIFESRSKECVHKKYSFAPHSWSKPGWTLLLS